MKFFNLHQTEQNPAAAKNLIDITEIRYWRALSQSHIEFSRFHTKIYGSKIVILLTSGEVRHSLFSNSVSVVRIPAHTWSKDFNNGPSFPGLEN
ncbi:MAG TPA: hypothetical protein VFB79_04305 [Candidatus Angelobacter sp.]|nr:hypothetical protein [Candidatus Angelobacter sp.]